MQEKPGLAGLHRCVCKQLLEVSLYSLTLFQTKPGLGHTAKLHPLGYFK